MQEFNVIYVDLPPTVKGMIVKMFDYEHGEDCFTIVINSRLNLEQQQEAFLHELRHFQNGDFDTVCSVDVLEFERHIG